VEDRHQRRCHVQVSLGTGKDLFRSVRRQPDKDTVVYCRIGERSSHTWFVLTYLLGLNNVRNYDGSWTEWGNKVGAPIEKACTQCRSCAHGFRRGWKSPSAEDTALLRHRRARKFEPRAFQDNPLVS
jgi:hypothetical protein